MRPTTDPRRVVFRAAVPAMLALAAVWGRGPDRALGADPKPPAAGLSAKGVITPATPVLPAELVALLQEKRYAEADAALAKLTPALQSPAESGYYAWIRAISQRLSGRPDVARATLKAALAASPKGPWTAKLRAELAGIELAAGRPAEAEELAREEAVTLLAGDRKDRLAEVYYAFARRLLKPDDPIAAPDPNGAFDLMNQARDLAKGAELRARLLLEMARASRQANNLPRALQLYPAFLKEFPESSDRFVARDEFAEAQLTAGQPLPARLTWTDLARDLAGKADDKALARVRSRALYGIARTYGIPNPPDDTQLNLGVSALRRFLADSPSHPSAVRAAYEIGASYLARQKSDEALAALKAFLAGDAYKAETDEARADLARLSMSATFQIASILQHQQKYDEAISAWKGYLAKFPNGPQSAEAQQVILDTQLLIASAHRLRERYDEARAAWLAFVAQNPLDPRVPGLLYTVGATYAEQSEYDKAVAAWEPLLSKFPDGEPAAHARFDIASIDEVQRGRPESAIERFRKIAVEPWKSQAAQRVAVMEARALAVVTPRVFRSGETAHLKVNVRNLEKLTFSAYKLNAEAYFRKKHSLKKVEGLDIGLVAPDAEWTVDVPGYAKFKPIEAKFDLTKIPVPGVYVVKVTDEKFLQATTLVIGSDVDAVVKTSSRQYLVYAQDMKTGKGRPNARVLLSQGDEVLVDAKTGPDGVLLHDWDKPRDVNAPISYLVLDGNDVCGSGLKVPETVAQGLSPRAYLYTDRPAYRPGQHVALRGVVREVNDAQYANRPGAVYKLEVSDSRGRMIVARDVTLSAYGTFHQDWPLDEGAPVGTYKLRLYQPGKSDFAGQFEVQPYRLETLDLKFDLKETVVFRGDTVEADVVARYQYGAPAAKRPISVSLPDGRVVSGLTDAAGKFHVTFPTEGFSEEQMLRLVAQLPEDNVATAVNISLAVQAFSIAVDTTREVYLASESFQANVTTTDPQGKPTGQTLSVALIKHVTRANAPGELEVSRKPLKTDPKTGKGVVSLRADDAKGGQFTVRVSGTDRFGNAVVTDHNLTIAGEDDDEGLRILSDRQSYKVGEEASVNLHSRKGGGTALLTWEADRILTYRIVTLTEGNNAVAWAVDGPQFPNFTLAASRMLGDSFDETRADFRVERDLRVTVSPLKPVVGPGEDVTVEVTTTDQLGRPVAAEVALALVDRSLLRLFGDKLPGIGPFFYKQTRTGSFATESTNTFEYHPATTAVASAVVEEANRVAAQTANGLDRNDVLGAVRRQVAVATPAAAPMAPAPMSVPFTQGSASLSDEVGVNRQMGRGMMGMGGMGGGGMGGDGRNFAKAAEAKDKAASLSAKREAGLELKEQEADFDSKSMNFRDLAKRDGVRFNARLGEAGGRRRAVSARERFVETAYWNPAVVTGADGKARVTFKAPSALSAYEFSARGVTGADTLVGQTTAELTVRKDFFVELKAPTALTQGDKPQFSARLHHTGLAGAAVVRLTIYAGGRDHVDPKTIDIKGDGVDEVRFEAFEVPEGDSLRVTLTAQVGEAKDELLAEIPVRPWGVQAVASASGTSQNDATVFVGLPAGRTYENPEMLVVVSPTVQRLLIELAMGREVYPLLSRKADLNFMPEPADTTADRASDLLAAASTLSYLRTLRNAPAAPEAGRLTDRIRGLVTELTALQNEDGGWPWVSGSRPTAPQAPNAPPAVRPSDRSTSARVVWALAAAEPLGLLTDANGLERAAGYLTQEYAKLGAGDHETRAAILHALSTRGKANFENANSLNRLRQSLSDSALAYLALTLANLDRKPLAAEILNVLGPRGQADTAEPGKKAGRSWGGTGSAPWIRSKAETTALVALAFAQVRPTADELDQAATWLLAHRTGFGWRPHKAKGPALAALASYYGRGARADDRYDLVVTVNDKEVYKTRVAGNPEGGAVLVPADVLKAGAPNRVAFHVEGRGTFGYSVTLSGFTKDLAPDQTQTNRPFLATQHIFMPAAPQLDGKTLPVGFDVAVGASYFENWAHQVPLGGKLQVRVDAHRVYNPNQPAWERDFLVLEDHIPAGCTLVEGSVQTSAAHYEEVDGVIRFYFSPEQEPGQTRYDLFGYLPGTYRTLPPVLSSAYEPGRRHMAAAGVYDLKVLSPGEANADPYKPTPGELYARGKAQFDAGRLADAAKPLEELFTAYTLRDDIARDAARMLLLINIKDYSPRKVVQYFEVVKEKAPDLVVTFDNLLVIGRAYRDINEHERAFLVWRGVAEASYLEDARVGEVLRQRGKTLEGVAYLIDLWREYPNTASIESDFFAFSQVLARDAAVAFTDPRLRTELAAAEVTRSKLLLQSVRLIQAFLSQSPNNPVADEASLALVNNFLDLEDYATVVKLSGRYARLYPASHFLDSFQFSEALGEFHLGHYDRAVEVAKTIAAAQYKDASGADQPSPNKWQAVYILGQIYDARRLPAEAVGYYKQVAERFTDAADALAWYTRKCLTLPEITVVPSAPPRIADGGVPPSRPLRVSLLRNAGPKAGPDAPEPKFPDELKLGFCNISEVDVKVYPVDLLRLYLTRRNLDAVAGIDLAGITPLVEKNVKLGSGEDFSDRLRKLDLGLTKEGAYLVMARGENLYASGIVLVTPLTLEVQEDPAAGRVRVTVRDSRTGEFVPKVQVKVIGGDNPAFFSGETDLRGVFVAEGIRGGATAVARNGTSQYAFYRGQTRLGQAPQPARPVDPARKPGQEANQPAQGNPQSLEDNLRSQNTSNQMNNFKRLEQRYQMPAPGQSGGAAAGGFR